VTNLEGRVIRLETLVTGMRNALAKVGVRLDTLESQIRQIGSGGGGSGGGGAIYDIDPVVIAASGNVTGQTVYALVGGTRTAITTTATVYNVMADATSATVTSPIIVGPNGDGTYRAVSQGCA
jgi:hypothetical protein